MLENLGEDRKEQQKAKGKLVSKESITLNNEADHYRIYFFDNRLSYCSARKLATTHIIFNGHRLLPGGIQYEMGKQGFICFSPG
jgi:hypothetical protein